MEGVKLALLAVTDTDNEVVDGVSTIIEESGAGLGTRTPEDLVVERGTTVELLSILVL